MDYMFYLRLYLVIGVVIGLISSTLTCLSEGYFGSKALGVFSRSRRVEDAIKDVYLWITLGCTFLWPYAVYQLIIMFIKESKK